MTNREQAKMTMYAGIDSFLLDTDNAAIYAGNLAFTTEKAIFDTAYTLVKKRAAKTGTDNSGFSLGKDEAKEEMAKKAATLSGFAFVRFNALGEMDLAGQLLIRDTDYLFVADALSVSRAQAAMELMNTNLAMLTPDYVTAADILALSTAINNTQNALGASDAAHQTEPQDTSAFKDSLPPLDNSIDNLKLLARFFQDSATEFYEEFLLVCELPPVNVHHTKIIVTVTASENSNAIAGATGTLSNTDKTGTSDLNGLMTIEEVPGGIAVLTVNAPGRQQVQTQLSIQQGKDNNVSVEMEVV
jgi:hypothetical protein